MQHSDEEEIKHLEIGMKLDFLDRLRPKILVGFLIFWSLWILAVIGAIVYYFL